MSNALVSGDYTTFIQYFYPKIIALEGGKEKMLKELNDSDKQMKAMGAVFLGATIGEPGKFYKAGDEIHCLVPQTLRVKTSMKNSTFHGYLLAASGDGGKNWTFIRITKASIPQIPKLFPNFNKDLKIPEPTSPM